MIFLVLAGLFLLILGIFSYDVSRRTTVPWRKEKNIEHEEAQKISDLDTVKTSDIKPKESN